MSRFVSAGSTEEPSEQDEAWLEAQKKIDATRQKKPEVGQQEGGKSLYETLQANKAAKQDAFEEATRLRNQFRSLDEDEVEFLDSVLESTREKEAEMKKETVEQLEAFRKHQEEAEQVAKQEESTETPAATETWAVGPRKRKKGREREGIGGVKFRRTSTSELRSEVAPVLERKGAEAEGAQPAAPPETRSKDDVCLVSGSAATGNAATTKAPAAQTPCRPSLGLAAYSSDEED